MDPRRLALIGAASCLAVALVAVRSEATPPPLPAAEPWAAWAGAAIVEPEGELLSQGRAVRASTFTTADGIDEVIAGHRAAFSAAPVDLHEQPLPDGRLLSILDIAGGRHLIVSARRRGAVTEVVRGWSALGAEPAPPPVLPLPEGYLITAFVEDRLAGRLVQTVVALAPAPAGETEASLRRAFAAGGWQEAGDAGFARGDDTIDWKIIGGVQSAVVQLLLRRGME